jgi:NADPH-dependent 2,4-dienoyl-CoA reductase/sulfur reductase-like enzyme/rhodanese-related sulfurtransferase
MKVLIVGGVAGGATCAARLRRLDEEAEIIVFERGEYVSYANCGLPYHVGGVIADEGALTLRTPAGFKKRFNIDVRVCSEVVEIMRETKTVRVMDLKSGSVYKESYDKLVLSPGAEPLRPPVSGLEDQRVFKLRDIPQAKALREFIVKEKPKKAAILGGGSVGVEMAENLCGSGLSVTIIEANDQILPFLDYDMASLVQNHLRDKGVALILKNGAKALERREKSLLIRLMDGKIEADLLLLSAGVRPESHLAGDCGIKLNSRGYIETSDNLRSSDPCVFAAGDAAEVKVFATGEKGSFALAGPANKEGRICADNIAGENKLYEGSLGSAILKVFDLTVASTGLSEREAGKAGFNYDKSFTISPNHAGYYPGASEIVIKTIFEKESGKLLGAQLIGKEGVDKRCDVIGTAIRFRGTAYDLTKLELAYAPPYGSAKDPVNTAGYVMENLLTGKVKNFHWHDIESLDPDKATLLDVRTEREFKAGSIPGFINIDLDSLRERLFELDKKKPVFVSCQIGLRGYLAARILAQKGFKVRNLSGGYAIWNSVMKNRVQKSL